MASLRSLEQFRVECAVRHVGAGLKPALRWPANAVLSLYPYIQSKNAIIALVVVLLLAGVYSAVSHVEAQQELITVEGRVVNGTTGSAGVSGLTVTFHEEGEARHDHMETTTDESGAFRFEGIQFDPSVVYGVSLRYDGALYGTDLDLSSSPPQPITLTVYDAVDNPGALHTTVASVLFAAADRSSQTIAALEIVQIANDSDFTYVPGTDSPMNLLRFGLPPDSRGLRVDTRLLGADIVQVDRGFAVLGSVPPGTHEIMYTYEFPYSGGETTFVKSLPFGAENLRVLSPYEVLTLSSDDIGDPESVTIGERPYQVMEATNLPRGSRITVGLSELPQMSLLDRVGETFSVVRFEYIAPVALGLLMAALTVYAIRRRKARSPAFEAPDTFSLDNERRSIHQLISDLEQSFNSGSLAEEDYRRRRRVLESRLSALSEG